MTRQDKTFDLIAIGDSTIDTFVRIHDASVECDINHEACKISLMYGQKIPVDSLARGVAGNATNVAAAATRLGLKTAIYTNLGGDSEGELIKRTFEEVGISDDYVVEDFQKTSNMSVIISFQGERTALVYHQPWFYRLPNLAKTKWVYFTSVAPSFVDSNIVDEVAHYIDKSGAKLAFAPGTFQLKANIKKYPKILERTELLCCNVEEAKQILEIEMGKEINIHDLLSSLLLLGPKMVLMTDGQEGSYVTDGNKVYKAGVFPTQVVEKTGAGDTYCAAFISALILGQTIQEAMVWGTVDSANVLKHVGPLNGQMTKDELLRYRKAVPEMVAKVF